jgi:hypothetical protein
MGAALVFSGADLEPDQTEIGAEPVTIGRDPGQGIVIDNEVVSRRHATIFLRDGEYVLRDEGSTNGTFVNNRKIKEQVLRDGDTVELGLDGPRAHFSKSIAAAPDSSPDSAAEGPGRKARNICLRCGGGINILVEELEAPTAVFAVIHLDAVPSFCAHCGARIDKELFVRSIKLAEQALPPKNVLPG